MIQLVLSLSERKAMMLWWVPVTQLTCYYKGNQLVRTIWISLLKLNWKGIFLSNSKGTLLCHPMGGVFSLSSHLYFPELHTHDTYLGLLISVCTLVVFLSKHHYFGKSLLYYQIIGILKKLIKINQHLKTYHPDNLHINLFCLLLPVFKPIVRLSHSWLSIEYLMNRLSVYSYLTRFSYGHARSGKLFKSLPEKIGNLLHIQSEVADKTRNTRTDP